MATISPFSRSASHLRHRQNHPFSPCIFLCSYHLIFVPTYTKIYSTVLNSNPIDILSINCHHLPTFGGYTTRIRPVPFDAALYLFSYRGIILHGGMHSSHIRNQPRATAPGAPQQVNYTQAVPMLSRLQFFRSNADNLNERDLFSTIRRHNNNSSSTCETYIHFF